MVENSEDFLVFLGSLGSSCSAEDAEIDLFLFAFLLDLGSEKIRVTKRN